MTAMEGWFVSKNDLSTYSVIDDFIQGRISRRTAAMILGRSERQVSRLATQVKKNGLPGVLHKNRGRDPHNKTDEFTKLRVGNLVKEKYFDFNTAHAHADQLKTPATRCPLLNPVSEPVIGIGFRNRFRVGSRFRSRIRLGRGI